MLAIFLQGLSLLGVRCQSGILASPLAAQRLSVRDYSPLVDQIANNISRWAAKSLSFAGRLELIRSVIQGVECFWLQIFPLPAAVVEKIHRLCRNFLWNSKRAPVAWEDICHPKNEGGLGHPTYPDLECGSSCPSFMEHSPQGRHTLGTVGRCCLPQRRISLGLATEEGRFTTLQRLAEIRNRIINAFGTTRRQSSTWPDGAAVRDLIRPKHMSTLGQNEQNSLGRRLHATDLCSYKRIARAHYASICKKRPSTYSLSARSVTFVDQHTAVLGIRRHMSTLLSAVKWLIKEKTRSSVQNKARLIALACTVYSLWRHRNEVIFEGKTPCPEELVISIKITVYRILLSLFPHELITY
ncbi:UNVERIFIED_CONTAM: hypothetical protein Sangu_1664600 [Sesamum angustifolium]|uniref:Reverse transcriptase n=1 Tax=Sesamum angustifolium TaxID=2727405 RepID=A0AAW2ML09_9LAMI